MLLQNSLFWEAEPILSGPATAQCVNASDDTIPGAAMVDAGFVDGFDPMSIGLMLANDSPNVDACGESTIFPDILGQPRNVGFLSPITLSDRGAFELQDVLFSDNFD